MKNYFLTIAGIFGAMGVALGALGAHALKAKMALGLITPDQLNGFDTAARYQLYHSLALVIVYFANREKNYRWLNISAWMFILGIILFSGSLYLLTTRNLIGMPFLTFLGPVTPLGGLAFMGGWICLIVHSIKLKKFTA